MGVRRCILAALALTLSLPNAGCSHLAGRTLPFSAALVVSTMFGGKFPGVSGFENQNEDASEQITSKAFQGKAGKAMGLKSFKPNWRAKGVKHGKGGKGPKDAAAGGNFKQPVKSENKENEGEEGATNFGKSGKAGKASKGAFVNQGGAAQELGSEAQKGLAGVATKEYGPSSAGA